jgi:hypothetical protein
MSPVFGVGSSADEFEPFRLVGEDEDPLSAVGRSNVGSWNARPVRVIPERGQVAKNSTESAAAEGSDVLHDDELGL